MFKKTTVIGALALSAVEAKKSNDAYINGTNIGGWMVLEPWVTPSIFYRFLGKTQDDGVGIDSHSLCEALGPKKGNELMRAHWDAWFNENDVRDLAKRGIDMVRLPIGDWTLDPYGPYVGCYEGSEDKIQWMFDTCAKYGIKVLLDIHGREGSQNGFDNSGDTNSLEWLDKKHFRHWETSAPDWIGNWDVKTQKYTSINVEHLSTALKRDNQFLKRWGSHKAFAAYEPVNEPWWNTPLDSLSDYYREVRPLVQKYAPQAKFVFHDSFRYGPSVWNDLFTDFTDVVLDHHYYQAFTGNHVETIGELCGQYEGETGLAEQFKMDVWFGEWAYATDNCAHWLGGFNDGNLHPAYKCEWVDCPKSYLPDKYAVDFDRTAHSLGPYGSGSADDFGVHDGKCSSDSLFFNSSQVTKLSQCAQTSLRKHTQGSFFWTAKNEIEDRWSYTKSFDNGWFDQVKPRDISSIPGPGEEKKSSLNILQ